jgi:hypothetical protein
MLRIARLIVFESLIFGIGGVAQACWIALGFEQLMRNYEPRLFAPVLGAGLGGRALAFASPPGVVLGDRVLDRAAGGDALDRRSRSHQQPPARPPHCRKPAASRRGDRCSGRPRDHPDHARR